MGNSQSKRLIRATKKGRWEKVISLLRECSYSSGVVEQIITTCEKYGVVCVDQEILTHCNIEQINRLMKTAVWEERWAEMKLVLLGSNYNRSVVNQFITACEEYSVVKVDGEILTHCNLEQRNRLMKTVVKEERWGEVNLALRDSNYNSIVVNQFITACEEYGVVCVDPEILTHCNIEQINRLMKTPVKEERWAEVKSLLQNSNYSSSVVKQIITACKEYGVVCVDPEILIYYNREQRNILNTAVRERRWGDVKSALRDRKYNSSVVEQFITACEENGVVFVDQEILTHCTTQLDRLLTLATTKKWWSDVDTILKAGGSHDKRVWVIEQACKVVRDWERYILPHCSDNMLESVLTSLVTRGLWEFVGKLLERDVSDTQHRWAVEEASKTANDENFERYILPHCSNDQLESVLTQLVTRGLWESAGKVLERGVSDTQRSWAVEEASKTANDENFERYIRPHCTNDQLESVLKHLVARDLCKSVGKVLERGVSDKLCRWAVEDASKTAGDLDFRDYILPHCSNNQLGSVLTHLVTRGLWKSVDKVLGRRVSDTQHRWAVEEASKTANGLDFKIYIMPHCTDDQLNCVLKHLVTRGLWHCVRDVLEKCASDNSLFEVCKHFTVTYTYTTVMRRIDENLQNSVVQRLINSLPSNQLSPEAQSVALRFALQQRRWDVISRASLSQVWEQVRRHLFREAVYQKKWTIVKKWADHTLYDDERWWALEEAYKHKRWNVMLQLADHGLTEIELMRVRYRLAKHADWDFVLRMIERGVDVIEVREVVESTVTSRKTKTTTDKAKQKALAQRLWQLRQLEEQLTRDSAGRLRLPSTARQWRIVLFRLHRHPGIASVPSRSQPGKTFGGLLLQRAIEQCAWHVVMHLVRLGIGTDKLDSMLTDMMRRRQWGVCRVLLEQGVSVQSCPSALSVFMEKNQWMLVSRVMEFIVDDALKSQVMQCAMERREGSVVGECISTMEHYRLSAKEREELFQQAISRGVLQAVKPLVEEKDETETQHRDAAMLAAIDQRQWDVVDCCQLQGVDIDMKDEHGETPLNREVRKEKMIEVEWKAVEELVVRGADPNVLGKDGCSVTNRAIQAKKWDIVRLLIEYLADIHKSAKCTPYYTENKTPLQFLIDERQGEIIDHTLIWCPDQAKGANNKGETTLHAIALGKKPENLYYQIVRGVNPLTLTDSGQSVLFYAVQNEHCPQRMVAECIRLGLGTHQPQLTKWTADVGSNVADEILNRISFSSTSPFLLAVSRGMPVVTHMLYDSGSCSSSELLHLYTVLLDVSDPHTEDGRRFLQRMQQWNSQQHKQSYEAFTITLTTFLPYLKEMASTPRSLESTCRLAISHCLTVRRRHERAVRQLPTIDRELEDYLLFSDLIDPDYHNCKDTELKKRKELEQWMKTPFDKIQKQLEEGERANAFATQNEQWYKMGKALTPQNERWYKMGKALAPQNERSHTIRYDGQNLRWSMVMHDGRPLAIHNCWPFSQAWYSPVPVHIALTSQRLYYLTIRSKKWKSLKAPCRKKD